MSRPNGLPPRPPPTANPWPRIDPDIRRHSQPSPSYAPYSSAPDYNNYNYSAPPIPASTIAAPVIHNPFPHPSTQSRRDTRFPDIDPELQRQIAEQQSIYDPSSQTNEAYRARAANALPKPSTTPTTTGPSAAPARARNDQYKQPTVMRKGGGKTWQDPSLLEWDPSHFRLFVGNLAGEVTDDSLMKAFARYDSVKKARVVRDKKSTKSKGYGFVAFSDGDEYFRAAREMQGKYIGSHPVQLKRSNTEIKPVVLGKNSKGGKVDKNGKKKKDKKRNEKKVLG